MTAEAPGCAASKLLKPTRNEARAELVAEDALAQPFRDLFVQGGLGGLALQRAGHGGGETGLGQRGGHER